MALTLDGDNGISGINGSATTPAVQGTDTNTGLTFGTDTVNVVTGGSTRTTVDSSGRLLVNTTSEFGTSSRSSFYSLLQVEGNTSGSTSDGRITLGTGATTGSNTGLGSIYFCDTDGGDRALIRGYSTSAGGSEDYPGYLTFWTNDGSANPTERMRIASDGSIRNMTGLYLDYSGSSANVHIASDGHLTRGSSSIRYKTQVEDLEDQYADALLECRPVWFRSLSKNDNPEWSFYGLIAEELADIDPRLVQWRTTNPVFQEDGSVEHEPCEPVAEGISYDRFVPHLLNLIKRQKAAIEALETRVAQLEGGAA